MNVNQTLERQPTTTRLGLSLDHEPDHKWGTEYDVIDEFRKMMLKRLRPIDFVRIPSQEVRKIRECVNFTLCDFGIPIERVEGVRSNLGKLFVKEICYGDIVPNRVADLFQLLANGACRNAEGYERIEEDPFVILDLLGKQESWVLSCMFQDSEPPGAAEDESPRRRRTSRRRRRARRHHYRQADVQSFSGNYSEPADHLHSYPQDLHQEDYQRHYSATTPCHQYRSSSGNYSEPVDHLHSYPQDLHQEDYQRHYAATTPGHQYRSSSGNYSEPADHQYSYSQDFPRGDPTPGPQYPLAGNNTPRVTSGFIQVIHKDRHLDPALGY